MSKRLTTEEFIKRSIAVHGIDRYDYSLVEYISRKLKVKIICKRCGIIFEQTPDIHWNNHGCPSCNGGVKITNDEFIKRAILVFGDRFDYSLVNYINAFISIKIICKNHGIFKQNPSEHISGRMGCKKCASENRINKLSSNIQEFIEKAIKIHGGLYDYSFVDYKRWNIKIKIKCNKCGTIFEQTPNTHLNGHGCNKCCKSGVTLTLENFIQKSKKLNGDEFDYSFIDEYINGKTKVKIKCNRCGNIFNQIPQKHLLGHGCPRCKISHGERQIEKWLNDNNIEYETQKTFNNLKGNKNRKLRFDFYLSNYNIAIEYDGEQHFREYNIIKNEIERKEALKIIKEYDKIKNIFCKKEKIKIIRIPYWDFKDIKKILNKEILNIK
jgi:predicted  nucleic acid-binding Zn-ribbon protein